jgi:hypothetical protein
VFDWSAEASRSLALAAGVEGGLGRIINAVQADTEFAAAAIQVLVRSRGIVRFN